MIAVLTWGTGIYAGLIAACGLAVFVLAYGLDAWEILKAKRGLRHVDKELQELLLEEWRNDYADKG